MEPALGKIVGARLSIYLPESPEVGESGVAADLVLLADSLVLGAVHLRDLHLKMNRY